MTMMKLMTTILLFLMTSGGMRRATVWLSVAMLVVTGLNASATEPAKGKDEWPVFRGDQGFVGVVDQELPATLKQLWKFKAKGGFTGSPIAAGGRVFAADSSGFVYAVQFDTGTEIWKKELTDAIEATPLVVDGILYVGCMDGSFHALDAATGESKWKFTTTEKIVGAANFFRVKDRKAPLIFVGSYDNKMYALDGASGGKVWEFETSNWINGGPAVANGKVVFGGCDSVVHVVDAVTGQEDAAIGGGAQIAGSIAVAGDSAYYGHYQNEVVRVDLKKQTHLWSYADRDQAYFSTPAVTKDRVVIGGRDTRVHCLDRETGKAIWTFPTKDEVDSSPVVSKDKVLVGSNDGRLYMLGLADGKQIWSFDTGGAITASPAVVNGRIIIGDSNGALYMFGAKP